MVNDSQSEHVVKVEVLLKTLEEAYRQVLRKRSNSSQEEAADKSFFAQIDEKVAELKNREDRRHREAISFPRTIFFDKIHQILEGIKEAGSPHEFRETHPELLKEVIPLSLDVAEIFSEVLPNFNVSAILESILAEDEVSALPTDQGATSETEHSEQEAYPENERALEFDESLIDKEIDDWLNAQPDALLSTEGERVYSGVILTRCFGVKHRYANARQRFGLQDLALQIDQVQGTATQHVNHQLKYFTHSDAHWFLKQAKNEQKSDGSKRYEVSFSMPDNSREE
jgi:hypothetical protein